MGSERSVTSGLSGTQRRVIVVATVLMGVAGGTWLGSLWGAGPFIRAVYDGDLLPYLGTLLRTHAANTPAHDGVEFYVQLMRGLRAVSSC